MEKITEKILNEFHEQDNKYLEPSAIFRETGSLHCGIYSRSKKKHIIVLKTLWMKKLML